MRPALLRYTAPSAGGASIPAVSTSGRILLPVSYIQDPFEVAIGLFFSSDAAAAGGVGQVFFTYDSMSQDDFFEVGVSQATTVITVTDPGLPARGGIAAGDVARLQGTVTQPLATNIDGEYVVATVVSPTSYTLTSTLNQTFAAQYGARIATFKMLKSYLVNATTARAFGNLSAGIAAVGAAVAGMNSGPVTAVALGLTALTAGSAYLQVLQGSGTR